MQSRASRHHRLSGRGTDATMFVAGPVAMSENFASVEMLDAIVVVPSSTLPRNSFHLKADAPLTEMKEGLSSVRVTVGNACWSDLEKY